MKAKSQAPSLDSICFPPLENESLSLKGNSMQLAVQKLCRAGRWSLYLAVPLRPGSRFNGLSNGCRAMRRLSCSSTMTKQAVRQRRRRQGSYQLARQRSLVWRRIRMPQTLSKPMTLRRFVALYGTQNLFVQTGLLTGKVF